MGAARPLDLRHMFEATQNRTLRSTFALEVDYRASSREDLFLASGWGIRDVGGPYIMSSSAMIIIPNWGLSNQHASIISLMLALSNRSPVDALLISVMSSRNSTNYFISKNDAIIAKFNNVILNDREDHFDILIKVGIDPHRSEFCDLVRIDKLRIDRNASSR